MTQNWKQRLVSAIATGALVAGMLPTAALAEGAAVLDTTTPDPGYSLTVTGLENGDTAQYYKIIEQDTATGNWKLTAAVDAKKADGTDGQDGKVDGSDFTVDDFVITDTTAADKRVLNKDMMNAIAKAITDNGVLGTDAGTAANGQIAVAGSDLGDKPAGMYMFVAIPGVSNYTYIYKPVFASIDYYNSVSTPDDGTHSVNITDPNTGDYVGDNGTGTAGVFKKSPLTIDKTSGDNTDWQQDVAVGDDVSFTIAVPVPTYSKNYTNPLFKVTDQLTAGLKLNEDSIEVKIDDETLDEGNYEVTDKTASGFTVTLDEDYLYTVVGAPTLVITYTAKVTNAATQQVNQMDNTATLEFSNNPNDENDHGTLKDKTRHYTFDIDADVLGREQSQGGEPSEDQETTSEIRKVAIDADGNVIVQKKETTTVIKGGVEENGVEGEYSWLEGATFKLVQTQKHVANEAGEGSFQNLDTPTEILFDANHVRTTDGGSRPTSDGMGYIPMKGLDAGVYELTEVDAPLGYAFNPNLTYTITITPTYVEEAANPDYHTGEAKDLILESYKVSIKTKKIDANLNEVEGEDVETISVYNIKKNDDEKPASILNEDGTQNTTTTITYEISDDPNFTAMVYNKKLGILPATGGSGIFFYLGVGGAVAVVSYVLMGKMKKAANKA